MGKPAPRRHKQFFSNSLVKLPCMPRNGNWDWGEPGCRDEAGRSRRGRFGNRKGGGAGLEKWPEVAWRNGRKWFGEMAGSGLEKWPEAVWRNDALPPVLWGSPIYSHFSKEKWLGETTSPRKNGLEKWPEGVWRNGQGGCSDKWPGGVDKWSHACHRIEHQPPRSSKLVNVAFKM